MIKLSILFHKMSFGFGCRLYTTIGEGWCGDDAQEAGRGGGLLSPRHPGHQAHGAFPREGLILEEFSYY